MTQPKKQKKAVVRADRSRRPANLPREPRNIKNKQTADDETDDQTECAGCGELYCESSEDWLACVACNSWYEISCAGMLGKPDSRTVFIVHSVNDLLCFMVWT